MKTFFLKSLICSLLVSILLISCSNEELETATATEIGAFNTDVIYHYKGQTFNEKELEEAHGTEIFYNTDWVVEDENNTFLYEDNEKLENHLEKLKTKSDEKSGKARVQIRFFESSFIRGRSITTSQPNANFHGFWNNRVQSCKLISPRFYRGEVRLYENQNGRGRSRVFYPTSQFGVTFFRFKARASSYRFKLR
ncbi:beta/gamma crystallin family protein [Aquimarina sp. RZ0]|uniref:beta/gamma crystallin family protein n=1 Tax=Aquimarina sp. RZ0 TaxID=2607730 RepID=UPI0011F3DC68|nr:beta/gamma crystallin family protein [Aquimarina sp. RZ0]KAA1244281.1 beta/gamma crystallin family protein [Aquimarina sp. RZ0]